VTPRMMFEVGMEAELDFPPTRADSPTITKPILSKTIENAYP